VTADSIFLTGAYDSFLDRTRLATSTALEVQDGVVIFELQQAAWKYAMGLKLTRLCKAQGRAETLTSMLKAYWYLGKMHWVSRLEFML